MQKAWTLRRWLHRDSHRQETVAVVCRSGMPALRRSKRQAAAAQQVREGDRVLVSARAFNGIEADSDPVRSAYAGQQVYTEEQLIGTAVWESRTHVGVEFDVDGALPT